MNQKFFNLHSIRSEVSQLSNNLRRKRTRNTFIQTGKRLLSVFLISSLMALSIQPAASASQGNMSEGYSQNAGDLGTITTSPIQTENQSDFYTDPHEDVPILAEKEELRESNIKHFIREDMSMEAVLYPTSVHYEKDGVWTDIDNRLVAVKEDGRTVYRNREAGYIVTFASDAKDNEWVKLEKS